MKRFVLLASVIAAFAFVISLVVSIPREAEAQSFPDAGGCLGLDGTSCCYAFPDGGLIYCGSGLNCMSQEATEAGTICHNDDCKKVGSYCCFNGTFPYCKGMNNGVALQCVPAGYPTPAGLSFTSRQSCQ